MKRYIRADDTYNSEAAFSADSDVRWEIAKTTDSLELLEIYKYDPDPDVRWMVAENPNTPAEILEYLSDDPDIWPRIGVAKNPNTPSEILDKLADDPRPGVREDVAKNPSASASTLIKVASHGYSYTSYDHLLKNENTPAEALEIIAHICLSEDSDALYDIISHPNVTKEILTFLSKVNDAGVRNQATFELQYRFGTSEL